MTEIRGASGKSIAEVCAEVKADMERDVREAEGQYATGARIATMFGNQAAAISALAGMIARLDECVAVIEKLPAAEEDWSSGITHPKRGDAVVTLEVRVTGEQLEEGWPTLLRTDPAMLHEFALSVVAALNEVLADDGQAYQPTVRIVSRRRVT